MILLNPAKYYLLKEALSQANINIFFARFVQEQKVNGTIYVDNIEAPKTCYLVHPYGMSLLLGAWDNENFNAQLKKYILNENGQRKNEEWMQAFPSNWDKVLQNLLGDKLISSNAPTNKDQRYVEQHTRVNFKFHPDKFLAFKKENIRESYKIIRTNESSFHAMKGRVIPVHFWNSATDFCKNGIGFSLYYQDQLATTAFSSFISEKELELGMETHPAFRKRGFAQYACTALIDYCMAHNYEPIWSCSLGNQPSYQLAQKLGFVPTLTLPYYKLSV